MLLNPETITDNKLFYKPILLNDEENFIEPYGFYSAFGILLKG